MGTLTADIPRLSEHCPHKLPSSCRLTSTPNCCACADERQHTTTYRTYIDGVGFVQRGTRWQGYCWFCKVFWDARVASAGLQPNETRIPDDPDQGDFVERWFEWHQGYRIERKDDGSEARIELIGEALKDADPGFLPRTREELESGRRHVLESDGMRRQQRTNTADAGPHVSIEDALDDLLEEASDDDSDHDEVYEITSQNQPAPSSTTRHPIIANDQARLDEALSEAQAAVQNAQRVRDRAEARLNNAESELSVLRERMRRIRRQQITATNLTRVFGTREDVNNEDYVSPITSMFIRTQQWGRQQAERQRELQAQRDALSNFADVHMHYGPHATEPSADGSLNPPPPTQFSQAPFRTAFVGDTHTFVHDGLPEHSRRVLETPVIEDQQSLNQQVEPHRPATEAEWRAEVEALQQEISELEALYPPGSLDSQLAARIVEHNRERLGRLERMLTPRGLQMEPAPSPATLAVDPEIQQYNEELARDRARVRQHGQATQNERRIGQPLNELDSDVGNTAERNRLEELSMARQALEQRFRRLHVGGNVPDSMLDSLAASMPELQEAFEASLNSVPPVQGAFRAALAAHPAQVRPRFFQSEPEFPGLDGDARPEPAKEEDMQRKLECKICLQQVADVACLPCGHLSMCEWCADQWVPTKTEDKTRPRDKGIRCPCCRARVKSRVKIYVP